MEGLFLNAESVDGDIGPWDVSGAKELSRMFMGASAFTGNIDRLLDTATENDAECKHILAGAVNHHEFVRMQKTEAACRK